MKICSKCKIEKDLSEFNKGKNYKDGLQYICKQCANEYYKDNIEYQKERNKKYHENNPNYTKKYNKKWRKENPEYQKEYYKDNIEYYKDYNNSKANYNTYASQISWDNNPIRNINEYLQTRCTYCGKWFFPFIQEIRHRINALNGKHNSNGAENRLYCSEECKQVCPIYHKHKYQEGHPLKNKNSSREVQPELRQMVFERDNYTCLKCNKHQTKLDVPLHCHHIEGIQQNPIMSADIDICVTVCKTCHDEIHQEDGCGYNDMKCKTGEKIWL